MITAAREGGGYLQSQSSENNVSLKHPQGMAKLYQISYDEERVYWYYYGGIGDLRS